MSLEEAQAKYEQEGILFLGADGELHPFEPLVSEEEEMDILEQAL